MSEIKDSLRRIVMAGFGAGTDQPQTAPDQLAGKGNDSDALGEDLTRGAADKIRQACAEGPASGKSNS